MENLIIFDFDNTLVDGNTDMVVLDLAPHLKLRKFTSESQKQGKGWGEAMGLALGQLHTYGLDKSQIDECVLKLKFFDHLPELLSKLKESGKNDIIILSHANDYFIDILLKKAGLESVFKAVHTYPAEWATEGCLKVDRYHNEDVNCQYCPVDCCKGYVLSKVIGKMEEKKGNSYKRKVFVGDGTADFCAALCLKQGDYVISREGYPLNSYIESTKRSADLAFEANHLSWKTGQDISDGILSVVDSKSPLQD